MITAVMIFLVIAGAINGYSHGHRIGYHKGYQDAIDKMQKVPVRK